MEMSDKLQFVVGFHYSSTAESHDKLKFVGQFWIRQRCHIQIRAMGVTPQIDACGVAYVPVFAMIVSARRT